MAAAGGGPSILTSKHALFHFHSLLSLHISELSVQSNPTILRHGPDQHRRCLARRHSRIFRRTGSAPARVHTLPRCRQEDHPLWRPRRLHSHMQVMLLLLLPFYIFGTDLTLSSGTKLRMRDDWGSVCSCYLLGSILILTSIYEWVKYSLKHVPGFIEKAEELKSKGVDEVLCISGIFTLFSLCLGFCSFLGLIWCFIRWSHY